MWKGEVVSVHLAPAAAAPMESPDEIRLIEGAGVEGDRYAKGEGTFSKNEGPHREVTLFEQEVMDTIARDQGIQVTGADVRFNIITRGAPLHHLVGKTFRVGGTTLRGVRLNDPCKHLERTVGVPGIADALINRCGLNAEIIAGGAVRPGDPAEEA
ncbi:MAG: MOSC domain-containing protein [bacterium]|nr:MOSC domain-containing protein [bacterium]